MHRIVTLLSDFGSIDHYVAVLKGVVLQIAPQVTLVDITHHIEPGNISEAGFVLRQALQWFGPDTIHVAVVDPGVGTQRRVLAGRWCDQIIVAPDNGLISWVHARWPAVEIHEVICRDYRLPAVSSTFHGRDIMAPLAGHLANGKTLRSVGPRLTQPVVLEVVRAQQEGSRLIGQVVHVDRFGNLISNVSAAEARALGPTSIEIMGRSVGPLQNTYADVPEGTPLAIIGSSELMEIAINRGHAARELGAKVGDEVILRRS